MIQDEMEGGAARAPYKPTRRSRGMKVLALLGCVVLQFVPTWQLQRPDSRVMRDFSAFYAAGTIVREGQANRLYDPALELRVERERTMRAANWLVEGGVRGPSRRVVLSCVALLYVLPMFYWNRRLYVAVLLGF